MSPLKIIRKHGTIEPTEIHLIRGMAMGNDYEKEKQEAIEAGESALSSLREAKHELNKARGWGIFDIIHGGLITTLIKHTKIDKAQSLINEAKWQLSRFVKELRDVEDVTGGNFGIGDFATFADFFFDGLIADFYVQSKINHARAQVDEAIMRVETALTRLRES